MAAVSPSDVWAVGNFLPDTATSNQDATLNTAAHFDGKHWTQTPVPDSGPNFNTLFGVAATPGQAWAVGVTLDRSYHSRSLIEAWDGGAWHIAATPKLNTRRDILYSAAAVSARDVWAVGHRQSQDGTFGTLIEHWDGTSWSVVPSADPGSSGNHLYGVAAAGPDDIWAVGQRDDSTHQARPLVEHLAGGVWSAEQPTGLGSGFTNVTGVAYSDGTVWAVGSYLDQASGNQLALVARNSGAGWHQVNAPNPGNGDIVLGGISAAGDTVWAAGAFDTDAGRSPLIELHLARLPQTTAPGLPPASGVPTPRSRR